MFWPVTLLGALAGWALASIPGALLGGLLGQVLDRRLRLNSWAALRARLWGAPADEPMLLFVMLGRLAKCEGRVLPEHIRQAKAEMQRLSLDAAAQQQAIAAFARGKTGHDSLRRPLQRQRDEAERLLRACWRMAWVDGQVGQTEQELILLWGQWLGVSVTVQEGWRTAYAPRRQGPPASPAGGAYPAALRVLGVSADTDPAQIKRAYRRLLSQHHPDKLTGSGASPERIREATERTRDLHQAYALVRQQRGFR